MGTRTGIRLTADAVVLPVRPEVELPRLRRRLPRRTMFAMVLDGARLTFETLAATHGDAPVRVDEAHDTLLRVVAGLVRVTIGADEYVLVPGEEAVVPAGAAHRLASVAGDARVVSGLRPARR